MAIRRADLEVRGADALVFAFPDRRAGVRRRQFARRRLGVAVMVCSFVMLTGHLAGAVAGGARSPVSPSEPRGGGTIAVIRPGDTLWDIAGRYAPEEDPRVVVGRLLALNGLGGRPLQAGTRIRIPD
jgi:LysM domain